MKQKRLLLILLCCITAVLIQLSFWNHPFADDYIALYLNKHYGFWGLQRWIYFNNTGRYTASFITAVFTRNDFLFKHYYLHSILLFLLSLFSWFLFIGQFAKHLLKSRISFENNLLYAFLFWYLTAATSPQVLTAYYWFSSAVTYQTSQILFLSLFSLTIAVCYNSKIKGKILPYLLIIVNIALLCGCNEPAALSAFFIYSVFLYLLYKQQRIALNKFVVLTASFSVSMCCLFLAPGIIHRSGYFTNIIFIKSIGYSIFWWSSALWYIFKTPLFWLFMLEIFCTGSRFTNSKDTAINRLAAIPLSRFLYLLAACNMFTLIPILWASNGSFPLRALNIISFINIVLLSLVALRLGMKYPDRHIMYFFVKVKTPLFVLLLFCNGFFFQMIQSGISGYFYDKLEENKDIVLKQAGEKHLNKVVMQSEDSTLKQIVSNSFHGRVRVTINDLIMEKPSLLWFEPEADYNVESYLLDYYHIDTLIEGNKIYINTLSEKDNAH